MHKDDIYDRPVVKLFLKYGYRVVDVKRGDIVSEQAAQQAVQQKEVVGLRTLAEIIADCKKELPERLIKVKVINGVKIRFLTWYTVADALDHFAPGWSSHYQTIPFGGKLATLCHLSIPTSDHGVITRGDIGSEDDDLEGYGDPTSNSKQQAFKRAAAQFGLGRYLYHK